MSGYEPKLRTERDADGNILWTGSRWGEPLMIAIVPLGYAFVIGLFAGGGLFFLFMLGAKTFVMSLTCLRFETSSSRFRNPMSKK